jgi:hypothetical protein
MQFGAIALRAPGAVTKIAPIAPLRLAPILAPLPSSAKISSSSGSSGATRLLSTGPVSAGSISIGGSGSGTSAHAPTPGSSATAGQVVSLPSVLTPEGLPGGLNVGATAGLQGANNNAALAAAGQDVAAQILPLQQALSAARADIASGNGISAGTMAVLQAQASPAQIQALQTQAVADQAAMQTAAQTQPAATSDGGGGGGGTDDGSDDATTSGSSVAAIPGSSDTAGGTAVAVGTPLGTIQNADGSFTLADGTNIPAGTMWNADGSFSLPDGSSAPAMTPSTLATGTPAGTVQNADGSFTLADGSQVPAGTLLESDGYLLLPDGTLQKAPAGTTVQAAVPGAAVVPSAAQLAAPAPQPGFFARNKTLLLLTGGALAVGLLWRYGSHKH